MDTLDLGDEAPTKSPLPMLAAHPPIHCHSVTLKMEIFVTPVGDSHRAVFARSFAEMKRVVLFAARNSGMAALLMDSLDSLPSQLTPTDVVVALKNASMRLPRSDGSIEIDPNVIHVQKKGYIHFQASGSGTALALARSGRWWHKASMEFPVMSGKSSFLQLKLGDMLAVWIGDNTNGDSFHSEMEKQRDHLTAVGAPDLYQLASAISKPLAGLGAKGSLVLLRFA